VIHGEKYKSLQRVIFIQSSFKKSGQELGQVNNLLIIKAGRIIILMVQTLTL